MEDRYCSPRRRFSGCRCCVSGMSVEAERKERCRTHRPWSAIAV